MPDEPFVHPSPIFRIEIDGVDISGTVEGRLINLSHTDNRGFEADNVELTLDDSDGLLDLPPRGAKLKLWIGWMHSGLVYKGLYTVDEVEHSGAPDQLSIRARSADLRAGLSTQRERSWHRVTLGHIVTAIAIENDLDAVISPALARQAIDHIDQTNESAVNLLSRLAKQFDAIATVKDEKLLFLAAAAGRSASGSALPTVVIERQSGDRHRFAIADRETYTGVRACYNDVQQAIKGEVIWTEEENAKESSKRVPAEKELPSGPYKALKKTYRSKSAAKRAAHKAWKAMATNKAARAAYVGVSAKYSDLNLGTSGEEKWSDPVTSKAEPATEADKIGASADNVKTLRHVYANKTNATRAARAEWRKIQRGVASFTITLAHGRPELFADLPTTVRGYKPSIDSAGWILTKVTNNIDDGGYTTSLDLEIKATEVADSGE